MNKTFTPSISEKRAAEYFGMSVRALQTWRYRGQGPSYYQINGSIRYSFEDLKDYAQRRKVQI